MISLVGEGMLMVSYKSLTVTKRQDIVKVVFGTKLYLSKMIILKLSEKIQSLKYSKARKEG